LSICAEGWFFFAQMCIIANKVKENKNQLVKETLHIQSFEFLNQ